MVEPPPGPLVVQADPGQLQQVILNLCRNASDAMDGSGRLTLAARATHLQAPRSVGAEGLAPGGHIVIAIEDHGRGIDATTLARIFEPVFTTRRQGAGLGLATALEITLALAGALAVTACTTPVRDQQYTPTASAQIPMEKARAECDFQVEAATASIGTNTCYPKGTTFDQELAQAIADGVIKGDEQNRLYKTCMRSKGFAGK